ncbi:MAG: hypothetical protein HYX63_03030 [Gammaproteobacteria bacterium]|nr:hypothetical protein [Gammaproteobacteria bacterium]
MTEGDLLQRIAQTLKQDIGPAVDAEYPKTQAFMAGVVLHKLGQQLALAPQHQRDQAAELAALIVELNDMLQTIEVPAELRRTLAEFAQRRDQVTLCSLIEALYGTRAALDAVIFARLLGRIRETLRADINRRVVYAS